MKPIVDLTGKVGLITGIANEKSISTGVAEACARARDGPVGDGERVYKFVSSPADYFLYTAADRPRGCHFPVVYADHGVIGEAMSGHPLHLLEMERLYPLADSSPAARLAARLIECYWGACRQWSRLGADMGRIALHHMTLNPLFAFDDDLNDALKALSDFVDAYEVLPDILNADNLMMRKDGTLVFSDSVFIA